MVHIVKSISELHHLFGLPKPKHPLISIIDLEAVTLSTSNKVWEHFSTKFYTISLKHGFTGKMKYGQSLFDFDEGVLSCIDSNQVLSLENINYGEVKGYSLLLNPDFLLNHTLIQKIKDYHFFSYAINEGLFLSDEEQKMIIQLFQTIENEYNNNIDKFTQEVILSNIDLLLVYINRYYERQFITRKNHHVGLLTQVEEVLSNFYKDSQKGSLGLPTVQYLAEKLHLSAPYLSDMLKNYTGLTAQQHIHEALINKAKELLTISELSVSQIAYTLGFEYPQSFNKLFKKKTDISPLKYRQMYN